MTASRSARARKAAVQAGALAQVRIDVDAEQQFVYRISCTECVSKRERRWSAYRPGGDNGFTRDTTLCGTEVLQDDTCVPR